MWTPNYCLEFPKIELVLRRAAGTPRRIAGSRRLSRVQRCKPRVLTPEERAAVFRHLPTLNRSPFISFTGYRLLRCPPRPYHARRVRGNQRPGRRAAQPSGLDAPSTRAGRALRAPHDAFGHGHAGSFTPGVPAKGARRRADRRQPRAAGARVGRIIAPTREHRGHGGKLWAAEVRREAARPRLGSTYTL